MRNFINKKRNIHPVWYIVDAKEKILGRLASKLASFLLGKHKIEYSPHIKSTDFVIVTNSEKIIVTGKKYKKKVYYHHTGYIGGIKKVVFCEMITKFPEKIIRSAVKGMLPKNSLGRSLLHQLKVYKSETYKQISQKPKILNIY